VAVKQKLDPNFFIIARTDAIAVEGLDAAVQRAKQYAAAGADAIFAEAVTDLEQYKKFKAAISSVMGRAVGNDAATGKATDDNDVALLANITEFGKTPIFKRSELQAAGVDIVLYPLSLFRVMNKAAADAMLQLKAEDSQQNLLPLMQTREELYRLINYDSYKTYKT
jgi:methylisocitrate lyase